jgi:hypothetical protein
MQRWPWQLRQLGMRRLSARYWQCERRYSLPQSAYLSIFGDHCGVADDRHERVDFAAFHVTFLLGVDRIHFYYHEFDENRWEPGGHTSAAEIRRYSREPTELRAIADRTAGQFAAALGMELMPRS